MGHSSKKKKRGGGGRKGKGRQPSKDHCSGDDQDLLSEELTALSAIFQEDFQIISQSPQTHFVINIRPHSDEMGYGSQNVSAALSVRCLPGYPYKCPKLQILPEKGLKQDDIDKLLSLLLDQANSNARGGRVMIFNLVEAAQEFLSEVVSIQEPNQCAPIFAADDKDEWLHVDASVICSEGDYSEGPFVCGLYDLFSDLCGDVGIWHQGVGTLVNDDHNDILGEQTALPNNDRGKSIATGALDTLSIGQSAPEPRSFLSSKRVFADATKNVQKPQPLMTLDVLKEDTDDDSQSVKSKISSTSFEAESSGKNSYFSEQGDETTMDFISGQRTDDTSGSDFGDQASKQLSTLSVQDDKYHSEKKDLLMVHLLRLACSTKGSLVPALSEIASELYNLGMLSERMRDMALEPPLAFNKTFSNSFQQHMVSSPTLQFWKASVDVTEDSTSVLNSRYLNDFEEIRFLGHGGFGHVVLCKNKLDGRHYAVKKIRLKNKSSPFNEKILREVATLARLQHQHVVRYYQAWFETESGSHTRDNAWGSVTAESSGSYIGSSSTIALGSSNRQDSTYLYIQMEYCPRTLHQDFETYDRFVDKELTWHLFRQIVEGLAHIHSQGIIHRDLTPNNIFFDARNDIKIGDFGLAKFLKLEQLDQDHLLPTETTGVSGDGTGQVGTYFYTAPEIEQGWPQINEKADMYSLGVVFFELWHPFGTAMERHNVLSDLKLKGLLPPVWVAEFPEQSSLVKRLMSPIPSNRPSARELLRSDLPPRMEDEWLNDILRTIQTAEDTYVYDRVISTIFDEDRITLKAQRQHGDRAKITRDESSFVQYAEVESAFRDIVTEVAKEVFRKHGARRLEITPMRLLDGCNQFKRKAVKLLTSGGNMLELCHELRSPFVSWVISNQKLSFKRYEISWVYRRAIGHSSPNRFLQGDFDIIGGTPAVTVAEVIKVAVDIASRFFHSDYFEIHLNHGQILSAIWSWIGIEGTLRQNVADVLSSLCSYSPQSAKRKSQWVLIRRQLLQGLNLAKSVVDRLQGVDLRFCGAADQSLARLRGALSPDKPTRKALDEISALFSYLRVWRIEKNVSLDVLMPPDESHYRGALFQVYLINENSFGSMSERSMLAVGGCYDHLLHKMWDHKSTPPSAVGVSVALEKILHHPSIDVKPSRNEPSTTVLVCSRGGGGLLEARMELVADLWQANIKADFVPVPGCSLTAHYDYASEHDIKLLIIITEAGLSQTGSVEVRNLELKKDKKIERAQLIKFLTDAVSTQFRSLSIWN